MHSPERTIFSLSLPFCGGSYSPYTIARIYHVDPCTDGTDDSCGFFMRSRHGDEKQLEEICKRLEWDWDRTFQMSKEDMDEEDETDAPNPVRYLGLFHPTTGLPMMSVSSIVLNIYSQVTYVMMGHERARKYMQDNIASILLFAENPTDSLRDSICLTFGDDGYEKLSDKARTRRRAERIHSIASIVYADVLRKTRPWWKHPKWHVHHWQFQFPLIDTFNRWMFSRCCKCGGRFAWGESVTTDIWDNPGPKFFQGERGVYHTHPPCGHMHAGTSDLC